MMLACQRLENDYELRRVADEFASLSALATIVWEKSNELAADITSLPPVPSQAEQEAKFHGE